MMFLYYHPTCLKLWLKALLPDGELMRTVAPIGQRPPLQQGEAGLQLVQEGWIPGVAAPLANKADGVPPACGEPG